VTQSSTQSDSKVGTLGWFTVDQFVGTFGIMWTAPIIAACAFDLLALLGRKYPSSLMFWLLTGTPYFPVQIALGLILGCLVSRHFRHRSMLLVWAIPFAVLCYCVVAVPTLFPNLTPPQFQAGASQSRLFHYFGWGCQPKYHCIDQTYVTLPFYAALSYSVGALLALRLPERFRHPNPRNFWFYLLVALFFLVPAFIELRSLVGLFRQSGAWDYLAPLISMASFGLICVLYAIVVWRGEP